MGDLNGDGFLDLVVTNQENNGTVSVLLGNGDGTFRATNDYALGEQTNFVAVGDFNGDGIPDLAVATGILGGHGGVPVGNVFILLGNGDGTFQVAAHFAAGYGPVSLAVADFNRDGKQDIVTTNFATGSDRAHYWIVESDVRVFLGNGDGTFQAAQLYTAGSGPRSVAVADVNADGIADLVVANSNDNRVSVLLGNGDGTFQGTRNYGSAGGTWSVVVADFNRDNYPDVAVANHIAPGTVTVLLNAADWGR